jgi:hypothetical protein
LEHPGSVRYFSLKFTLPKHVREIGAQMHGVQLVAVGAEILSEQPLKSLRLGAGAVYKAEDQLVGSEWAIGRWGSGHD